VLLGFVTSIAAAFLALGFWEVRWWSVGSAAQIALVLVLVGATRRPWVWVVMLGALIFLPATLQRIAATRATVRQGVVDQRDVMQPLYRDIAAALRATNQVTSRCWQSTLRWNWVLATSDRGHAVLGKRGGEAAAAIFSAP
jgi:hypothetical protein